MAVNPCSALAVLTDYQVSVLDTIGQKFTSLQRLATILEQAGDLADIISPILQSPNLIIPLSALNSVDVYNNIRNACPMLGLPEASADSIYQLQYQMALAYAEIMKKLDLHQYNRMDELQARLDDMVADAANALGRDWITCANVLCSVPTDPTVKTIAASIAESTSDPTSRLLTVLNSAQQQKVDSLNNARIQILRNIDSTESGITSLFTRWR